MVKRLIAAALASSALAGAAVAAPAGPYVGVSGGIVIVEHSTFQLAGSGDTVTQARYKHDNGWTADGVLGYNFGKISVEADVGYQRGYIDSLVFDGSVTGLPAGNRNAAGETNVKSAMLNALYNINTSGKVSAFIGGGAGVAQVEERSFRTSSGIVLDDKDRAFAFQGIAGARASLSQHFDVTLKYRYFDAEKLRLASDYGDTKSHFRSQSLLGGLVYNMGGEAPPPPPPPPAASAATASSSATSAAAPPPAPTSFIIFFDWNKADITSEAASILDNAAATYTATGSAQVTLAGHADTSGPAPHNQKLSQRRADAAKAYMVGKGIPDGSIATEAYGETRPLVQTADGIREPQNRRVEINLGPGSGQ